MLSLERGPFQSAMTISRLTVTSSAKAIGSHDTAPRDVAQHDFDFIFPRAGTCPKVKLIKGEKCTRAVGAKASGACLPPSSNKNPTVAPKTPGQPTKPPSKPKSSKKPPKKSNTRGLEEGVAALTFEERTDETLNVMDDIASFEWKVGDTAITIGLAGCSAIALYNDRAIVWGYYSLVITQEDGNVLGYQETLDLAFRTIESKARSMGILGAGRAKGVVRIHLGAASLKPPPGMTSIPRLIANWFLQLGVTDVDRDVYSGGRGRLTIKHVSIGNAKVDMS